MEWMLQVVDDMDDTVNAVLQTCLGFNADLGTLAVGGAGVAAIAAGIAFGAAPLVIVSAAAVLAVSSILKLRSVQRSRATAA